MSPCCSGFATKIDGSHQTLMNAILCFASSVICISVLALISHISSYIGNSNMSIKLFVWEPVRSFKKRKKNSVSSRQALHTEHTKIPALVQEHVVIKTQLGLSFWTCPGGRFFLPAKHFSNFLPASLTSHTADLMPVRERIKFSKTGGKRKLHFENGGMFK